MSTWLIYLITAVAVAVVMTVFVALAAYATRRWGKEPEPWYIAENGKPGGAGRKAGAS